MKVSLTASPIRNSEGTVVGACEIAREITKLKRAGDALREGEDRCRDLVEHSQDLLCTHDLSGKLLSCNLASTRILGYEVAELLEIPMRELIAPEYRQQFDAYLARIKTVGRDKGLMAVITRTGERRVWEYNTLRTEGVPSPIVRGIAHDITERIIAQRELLESEERFRQLVENIREVFYLRNVPSRHFLYVSPAYEQVWGRTCQSLYEDPASFLDAIHAEDRDAARRSFANQAPFTLEYRIVRADGSVRCILDNRFPIHDKQGRVYRLAHIAEDITERKRMEASAREFHGRLLRAQDEERQRISRELHDDTCGNLTALVMTLTSLKKSLPKLDQKSRNTLSASLGLARESAREVRYFSYLLHPPLLDDFGLADALRWYAREFSERSGIDVKLDLVRRRRLSKELEVALFRVIQEGLNNVNRHSGSKRAVVRLRFPEGHAVVEVRDFGGGVKQYSVSAESKRHKPLGMGISGMHERLQQFQGELQLHSTRNGTLLRATVPLKDDAA